MIGIFEKSWSFFIVHHFSSSVSNKIVTQIVKMKASNVNMASNATFYWSIAGKNLPFGTCLRQTFKFLGHKNTHYKTVHVYIHIYVY